MKTEMDSSKINDANHPFMKAQSAYNLRKKHKKGKSAWDAQDIAQEFKSKFVPSAPLVDPNARSNKEALAGLLDDLDEMGILSKVDTHLKESKPGYDMLTTAGQMYMSSSRDDITLRFLKQKLIEDSRGRK